jgi:hypothetical protein
LRHGLCIHRIECKRNSNNYQQKFGDAVQYHLLIDLHERSVSCLSPDDEKILENYPREMFVSSTSSLRTFQSLGNFANRNKVEDDEGGRNNNVDDGQGSCINAIEVTEQTNHEVDGNNHQHYHEERNLKLGQEWINFNRRVTDSFVPSG